MKRVLSLLLVCSLTAAFAWSVAAAVAEEDDGTIQQWTAEFTYTTETIKYDHKTTEEYVFPHDFPSYHTQHRPEQTCGIVCATEILSYYDAMHENLIPNCRTYSLLGKTWLYTSYIPNYTAFCDTVYDYMGKPATGADYNSFQKGMKKYVEDHGYKYSTNSVMGLFNWWFDYGKAQSALRINRPVMLFTRKFTFATLVDTDKEAKIYYQTAVAPHGLVACGYRVERYYNKYNWLISTKKFLTVVTEFMSPFNVTYLSLEKSTIFEAMSVMIE